MHEATNVEFLHQINDAKSTRGMRSLGNSVRNVQELLAQIVIC